MKKTLLEISFNEKPSDNDIIVCKNGKWIVMNKSLFLEGVYANQRMLLGSITREVEDRENEIATLDDKIEELKIVIRRILGLEEVAEESIDGILLGENEDEQ